MVSVHLAAALRGASPAGSRLELEDFEGDLRGLLREIGQRFGPGLSERILERGEVRRFVNVFVDGQDIRFQGGLDTPVPRGAVVDLIPAVAGG